MSEIQRNEQKLTFWSVISGCYCGGLSMGFPLGVFSGQNRWMGHGQLPEIRYALARFGGLAGVGCSGHSL